MASTFTAEEREAMKARAAEAKAQKAGQPAYEKDGDVVVFFQAAAKFTTRYLTLGFQDVAALDGTMWPASFAVTEPTAANAEEITRLVKKAVGA